MEHRALRILSIDDDPGCQRAAAQYFTRAGGHMVEVAFSGKEGLKKAEESRPDAIILDICMPDMNGFEVLDALHANTGTRGIPVFILTGASLTLAEEERLMKTVNFRLLVQKPAAFSELLNSIETAISLNSAGQELAKAAIPERPAHAG